MALIFYEHRILTGLCNVRANFLANKQTTTAYCVLPKSARLKRFKTAASLRGHRRVVDSVCCWKVGRLENQSVVTEYGFESWIVPRTFAWLMPFRIHSSVYSLCVVRMDNLLIRIRSVNDDGRSQNHRLQEWRRACKCRTIAGFLM
jgi:hypothetical protein